MSRTAGIILLLEILGALIVSLGLGLVFVPAGIIALGVFILVFTIAFERSRA